MGEESAAGKPDPPVDELVTTSHTLRTPAGELSYTATAGRIVLRHEKHTDGTFDGHEPQAEVFLVAYTSTGPTRPRGPSPSRSTADRGRRACGCTSGCSDRAAS